MSIPPRHDAHRPTPRMRWLRIRLSTLLILVVVVAVILACWVRYREADVPWHKNGGMFGWTQAAMVARLGQPVRTVEAEVQDPVGQAIRISPPTGPYRTLFFETLDGHFVAWFSPSAGKYVCYRSTWVEKGIYY